MFNPVRKWLLFFLFLFLLFLPIEFYFRQKYADFAGGNYLYTIRNFHPFLQLQQDPKSSLHINSAGFRGEEISKIKPKGTYRIFVLGGSTVLNAGVSYEKNATYLLEQKLQKEYPDRKIEVLNAGVDGYTSEHSLIQYLFDIRDFSPDMIIMWHGINDWYYSCSPSYISTSSFKPDYSHMLGATAPLVHEHFSPAPLVSFHSVAVDRLGKFLSDNLYSDLLFKLKSVHPKKGIYEGENLSKTFDKKDFSSLTSYERNVTYLIDQTKRDNVTLLLGDQPFLYSTHMTTQEGRVLFFPSTQCSVDGMYPSLASVISSMNSFNATTKNLAEENAIPFVDLAASIPKTLTYFTDDVHYTEKGNALVAETLFKAIQEKNLIP